MDAWATEQNKTFSILADIPPVRAWQPVPAKVSQTAWREHDWIAAASWTFCPDCGRRRPDGVLEEHWFRKGNKAVAVPCDKGCDLPPHKLLEKGDAGPPKNDSRNTEGDEPAPKRKKQEKLQAYVTPNQADWPEVFLRRGKPVLTEMEAKSLSIILLDATFMSEEVRPPSPARRRPR